MGLKEKPPTWEGMKIYLICTRNKFPNYSRIPSVW